MLRFAESGRTVLATCEGPVGMAWANFLPLGAPIFLARNSWELRYAQKQFPSVVFSATRERVAAGHGEN